MRLIDTSILLPVFRDKSGQARDRFRRYMRGSDYVLTRFTRLYPSLWPARPRV